MRVLTALMCLMCLAAQAANPPGTIQLHQYHLTWQPGPPTLPKGVETVVLEGDPRQPGLFTLRLRVPAGARLAPHTHAQPERVTVLSGAIGVGFGAVYDPDALTVFRAGDYYVNPPGAAHYVGFLEDSVVQVTSQGPWTLDYLSP